MAIDGFQPEGVAHDYHVAVCAVVLGHAYHLLKALRMVSLAWVLMSMPLCLPLPRPYGEMTFPPGRGKEYSLSNMVSKGSSISFRCENSPGVVTRTWLISMAEKLFFFSCAVASRGAAADSRQEYGFSWDGLIQNIVWFHRWRKRISLIGAVSFRRLLPVLPDRCNR